MQAGAKPMGLNTIKNIFENFLTLRPVLNVDTPPLFGIGIDTACNKQHDVFLFFFQLADGKLENILYIYAKKQWALCMPLPTIELGEI